MKVTIHDPDALRALRPLEVSGYLRARGWHHEGDIGDKGAMWLWRPGVDGEVDVTVPLRRELGDYSLRMAEVLRAIAEVENRSELDLLRDLLFGASDLIRIRAPGRDTESGTLPLEKAVTFVERSRDLMMSAACAAIDKRAYFATRKPQQAVDYLGRVKMGQTEHGSYVLTILSPVPPELRPAQVELLPVLDPELPYERQVTTTLMTALTALGEAVRQAAANGDMEPFGRAVARGVSANLCDAVAGLSSVSPTEGLDVQVTWSRSRLNQMAVPNRIRLDADAVPIIEEAARQFRETATVEDFALEGIVTRLNRGPDATEGDITVSGYVEGWLRNVVVRLGVVDYGAALRAHGERLPVRCTGELAKEGRGYRLRDPRQFRIVEADADA